MHTLMKAGEITKIFKKVKSWIVQECSFDLFDGVIIVVSVVVVVVVVVVVNVCVVLAPTRLCQRNFVNLSKIVLKMCTKPQNA